MTGIPEEELIPCATCEGTGTSGETCTVCHGTGMVLGVRCWGCRGTGEKPCAICQGAGTEEKPEREGEAPQQGERDR